MPTVDTVRLSYLLDLLVPNQHRVMFVGNSGEPRTGDRMFVASAELLDPDVTSCCCLCPARAGTGKTAIMRDKLRSLDGDAYMSYTINLNSKHDGPSLQPVLEAPLEKKAGAQR